MPHLDNPHADLRVALDCVATVHLPDARAEHDRLHIPSNTEIVRTETTGTEKKNEAKKYEKKKTRTKKNTKKNGENKKIRKSPSEKWST